MMSLQEFLYEWKRWGFKVACDNWLITFTKFFIEAKRIQITFGKRGEK